MNVVEYRMFFRLRSENFFKRCVDNEKTFQQEGWHYELDSADQELTYKGVVYNERKGVYSSPDSVLAREAQQALFPDNTYGVDSGGDPTVIPKLSFEEFKEEVGCILQVRLASPLRSSLANVVRINLI